MIVALGWLCVLVSLASLAVWCVAIVFIVAGLRAMPRLNDRAGDAACQSDRDRSLVSIIMPAHNEERVIDEALTLLRQSTYSPLEIIVAADRCTDQTISIVQRHAADDRRVRLAEVTACPEGWSGKCHAAWQGYRQASGQWLLFTDADTLFDPALVQAAVDLAERRSLGLLSLLGSLSGRQRFEKTTQPVAAMTLMTIFPIQKANRIEPERRRPFANGQFMLFTRDGYELVGTHAQARAALLEDLYFALWAKKRGLRAGLTVAGRLFRVRMYGSKSAFVSGWKRIMTEATNRNIARLQRIAFRLRLLGLTGPSVVVCAIVGGMIIPMDAQLGVSVLVFSITALLAQYAALALSYPLSGASRRSIWRYPLGCFDCAGILSQAVGDLNANRGIEWADLHYEIRDKVEQKPSSRTIRERRATGSGTDRLSET